MITKNNINNCSSIKELTKQLKRRKLSAGDAFQLPRTIRMLVRQDALEFELKGEIQAVIDLYTQVSKGFNRLTGKVPPMYRPLIQSSAKFWESEAEKAKAKKVAKAEQNLPTMIPPKSPLRTRRKQAKIVPVIASSNQPKVGLIVKSPATTENLMNRENRIAETIPPRYRRNKLSLAQKRARTSHTIVKKLGSRSFSPLPGDLHE